EGFQQAWWLTASVAGIRVMRRAETAGARKVMLLYAARCLNRFIEGVDDMRTAFERDDQLPLLVAWHESRQELTPEMIAFYRDGLLRETRQRLIAKVADLVGETRPHPMPRTAELPPELSRLYETLGDELVPDQPITAGTEGQPVQNVRARLMELSRVVLLGEPGSGKTTTLSRLAWDYVDKHRQDTTQPLP